MIDCWKYNLTENVKWCFIENWFQTQEFWVIVIILLVIGVVVFLTWWLGAW
jgi:hypothetical protein